MNKEKINDNITLNFETKTIEINGDVEAKEAFSLIHEKHKDIVKIKDNVFETCWNVELRRNSHLILNSTFYLESPANFNKK